VPPIGKGTSARSTDNAPIEMRDWLVAADDRTGAFEVAALFAQIIGTVTVTAGEAPTGSGVVDIGSRAMAAADAATAAAAVDASASAWSAHKIDSTLRGNWAAELMARQRATGQRVVLLPGWPEMGRTCVGGVVYADGVAVGNVRDHLPEVELLADADALRSWLEGKGSTAACDVPNEEAMHAAAKVLADHDVLVAGPAGSLGAVFAARHATRRPTRMERVVAPVLVVCGSAHPVAHEQIRQLRASLPDVEIIATESPDGELQPDAAAALAAHARARIDELRPRTVVIIGGETAAAVLGDTPRTVSGFAAVGMPYSRDTTGRGPPVVTKAGSFGGPDALVDLLRGENG